MDFHLTNKYDQTEQSISVLQHSQAAEKWLCQCKQTYIFLVKLKCQFSPAIDSDNFNQLKETKRADVDDKLGEVIALCEAA